MLRILAMSTSTIIGIAVPAALLVIIGIALFFLNYRRKNKKTTSAIAQSDLLTLIVDSSGGRENIAEARVKMTRLTLTLRKPELFSDLALKAQGIVVIAMEKKITLVLGEQAAEIGRALNG